MKVAKRPSAQKSYRKHRKTSKCRGTKPYACAVRTDCRVAKGKKRTFCRTIKNKKTRSMTKKQRKRTKRGGYSSKNKKGGMGCNKH